MQRRPVPWSPAVEGEYPGAGKGSSGNAQPNDGSRGSCPGSSCALSRPPSPLRELSPQRSALRPRRGEEPTATLGPAPRLVPSPRASPRSLPSRAKRGVPSPSSAATLGEVSRSEGLQAKPDREVSRSQGPRQNCREIYRPHRGLATERSLKTGGPTGLRSTPAAGHMPLPACRGRDRSGARSTSASPAPRGVPVRYSEMP